MMIFFVYMTNIVEKEKEQKNAEKLPKWMFLNILFFILLYGWLTRKNVNWYYVLHYSFCGSMSFCYHLLWAFLSGRDESIAWVWESIFRLLYDQKWENVPISFWVLLLLGKFVFLFCTYFTVRNVHGHVYLLN